MLVFMPWLTKHSGLVDLLQRNFPSPISVFLKLTLPWSAVCHVSGKPPTEKTNKPALGERRSKWRKELKHVCVWCFTVIPRITVRQKEWQQACFILTSVRNHTINFQRGWASRTNPSFHPPALIFPIPPLTLSRYHLHLPVAFIPKISKLNV